MKDFLSSSPLHILSSILRASFNSSSPSHSKNKSLFQVISGYQTFLTFLKSFLTMSGSNLKGTKEGRLFFFDALFNTSSAYLIAYVKKKEKKLF